MMRSKIFLLLSVLLVAGCSSGNQGGATPDPNANAGTSVNLQNQILTKKTFDVDPESDLATYWNQSAIPASVANSLNTPEPSKAATTDVPNKTIIVTFDDQNILFRLTNGETRAAKWIFIPPNEIMTTISGKDVYWKASIQENKIIMNLRDKKSLEPASAGLVSGSSATGSGSPAGEAPNGSEGESTGGLADSVP